jgi:hypothetical protein
MRIAMGDSEAVAVEICQEIVGNYLTRNRSTDWKVVCPLLRGALDQEEIAVKGIGWVFSTKVKLRKKRSHKQYIDKRLIKYTNVL